MKMETAMETKFPDYAKHKEEIVQAAKAASYVTFGEAIQAHIDTFEASQLAIADAVELASTVQDCQTVCQMTPLGSDIHKAAFTRMREIGQKQLLKCETVNDALEISTIARRERVLRIAALYKALELAKDFNEVKLVSKRHLGNDDLTKLVWSKMLKLAKNYGDLNYFVNHIPAGIGLSDLREKAIKKREVVFEKAISDADTLSELARLYGLPEYVSAKSRIRFEFNELYQSLKSQLQDFESTKKLLLEIDSCRKVLGAHSKSRYDLLKLMLKFAENFNQAQFVYKKANNSSDIKVFALKCMSEFADKNAQREIVERAPEFYKIDRNQIAKAMMAIKMRL